MVRKSAKNSKSTIYLRMHKISANAQKIEKSAKHGQTAINVQICNDFNVGISISMLLKICKKSENAQNIYKCAKNGKTAKNQRICIKIANPPCTKCKCAKNFGRCTKNHHSILSLLQFI